MKHAAFERKTGDSVSVGVSASVPGTEVLLLSMNALQKLDSDADRARVWRNLARCIAQRLVARTSM